LLQNVCLSSFWTHNCLFLSNSLQFSFSWPSVRQYSHHEGCPSYLASSVTLPILRNLGMCCIVDLFIMTCLLPVCIPYLSLIMFIRSGSAKSFITWAMSSSLICGGTLLMVTFNSFTYSIDFLRDRAKSCRNCLADSRL